MGFQAVDITPLQNPSPLIPTSKDVVTKAFKIARTETASVVKMVLPADASILHVIREGSVASDAATTATVTITAANNGGTLSSATDSVKTNGATTGFVQMSSLPNLQPMPLNGDITITAVYAETGTASTTGGPWTYLVTYVR